MKKNIEPNMNHPIVKTLLGAYHAGQEDEALEPLVTTAPDGKPLGRMQDGGLCNFL